MQEMHVRGENTLSGIFNETNGIKQGGMLAPMLFNMHMNDLSIRLNNNNIGGTLKETLLNHLCYADDLALYSVDMQKFIKICEEYPKSMIQYLIIKKCLIYKPKDVTFEIQCWNQGGVRLNLFKNINIWVLDGNTACINRLLRKWYVNVNTLISKYLYPRGKMPAVQIILLELILSAVLVYESQNVLES